MKGRESKCKFDFQPLKVKNRLKLHECRFHATYHWKAIDEIYNFALNLTSIKGLQKKLQASKFLGVPILKNLGLPTWETEDKMTFGHNPHGYHKEYYKGEGGGFPQI
jgi:hypothetical protein